MSRLKKLKYIEAKVSKVDNTLLELLWLKTLPSRKLVVGNSELEITGEIPKNENEDEGEILPGTL